jgi:hypothetical protein
MADVFINFYNWLIQDSGGSFRGISVPNWWFVLFMTLVVVYIILEIIKKFKR